MCKPLLASINSPRLCGHSVGLVCSCDSRVVYSLFLYHQKNLGDPGSSRGMFERIRVGLTIYISTLPFVCRDLIISQREKNLLTAFHSNSTGQVIYSITCTENNSPVQIFFPIDKRL